MLIQNDKISVIFSCLQAKFNYRIYSFYRPILIKGPFE